MNPETGSFARCVKHPSQFFTGFCSVCLVEKLSNVDSVESTRNPLCFVGNERLEICESVPNSQRKIGGARARRTLSFLFELDDMKESEIKGIDSSSHQACCEDSSKIDHAGMNFELDRETYTSFDCHKPEPLRDESSKNHGMSFWFYSKFPMKGLKWRCRTNPKKSQLQERRCNTGIGVHSWESYNNRDCFDSRSPSKVSWEKPRHSWDGSMMSKALTCSFSCLEEQRDSSGKIKGTSDPQISSEENDIGRINIGILADHSSLPPDNSCGDLSKELQSNQPSQDASVSDLCRKKSNGWIRVWDWNITSPFRDFAKRNGHALERSLSESWRDNTKSLHAGAEVQHDETPSRKYHVNRSWNRGIVTPNANRQGQKPDWQKKREFKLSRSHSVRYSSPRNLDNGLLRFYLTPLRTSRRNTVKCRRRTSHSLPRGFFGL